MDKEEVIQKIVDKVSEYEYSTFNFGIQENHPMKSQLQSIRLELEKRLGKRIDFADPDLQIILRQNNFVYLKARNVYVFCRYKKNSRELPQSPWSIKAGTNPFKTSIAEIIIPFFREAFFGEEALFHAAGREDFNVRMLGNGRPFVMEVLNPKKRNFELDKLESMVNSSTDLIDIEIVDFTDKARVVEVKQKKSDKLYSALVEFSAPVDTDKLYLLEKVKDLELVQENPTRVAKTRANLKRIRHIRKIEIVKVVTETLVKMNILAEHGTYIKEFISSDNGKTKPSVRSIMENSALCKELDVMHIYDQ